MAQIKKNTFKKITLFSIIIVELIIFFILAFTIFHKQNVLGVSVSVSPIKKEDLIFSETEGLKHFYEPKANKFFEYPNEFTHQNQRHWINDDSLNENINYPIPKKDQTYRIVALGDSFTFGKYVNTEENYVENLERKLNKEYDCRKFNKIEVINLGMEGYDLEYSVERFKLRGVKYNPDMVLWLIKDDDFNGILDLVYEKKKSLREQIKKEGNSEYYSSVSKFFPASGIVNTELKERFGEEAILAYQGKVLESLNNYYSGQLIIFTFPQSQNNYKKVISELESHRPKTLFTDQLTDIYKLNAYFPDKHPNKEGYRLIADFAYDQIKKNNLIPCD